MVRPHCSYALLVPLFLLASILGFTTEGNAAERPPNIVFILADDLGYGELGCYGQKKFQTPHIDRLAAEGMRFTQCYAGSCVCAPSRSVLMTGQHTGHTPVRANGGDNQLFDEDITVAEVLKKAGYATGGFGKWGLGTEGKSGHPNRQGFDEFFGYLHQVHAHFYYPYFLWRNETVYPLPENEGRKRERYAHDEIHREALQFIRKHHDEPFFCYLPYTIPHVELVVPEDSLAKYRGKWKEEPLPDPRPGYIGADEPYATFAGMMSRLDDHVGEIMALLKELKLDENTIVFFASDNGGQGGAWKRMTDFFEGNGVLRDYKGAFYEGGIRVPMIARWPGRIKPGSVTDHVCAFWDVLPTLAELAGETPPSNVDGISFVPTLLGTGTQRVHDFLYWEYQFKDGLHQAVRQGDWKYVRRGPSRPAELFNLKTDIEERENVAKSHPQVVEQIERLLSGVRTEARDYSTTEPYPKVHNYVR